MDQDQEERIRVRAYEIWEREGRQENSHEAHWQQAENELREEAAGEQQQLGNDAAAPEASGSGSDQQSSGSAPPVEAGAGNGSNAGAPARTPRKKSRDKAEGSGAGTA